MPDATLKEIMAFFSTERRPMGPKEMQKEWKELSIEDKAAIKGGLSDGSLTY